MALQKQFSVEKKAKRKDNGAVPILSARGVGVMIQERQILQDLDLDVYRGEILGFVGASGIGKSVLMRTVLGLNPLTAGHVSLFGEEYLNVNLPNNFTGTDQRLGVMFQHGALYSSLTVLENIQLAMREYLNLSPALMDELARLKLSLVGLSQDAAGKMPHELSGGMIKRAALARALALDPELIFLDEPTSGLDPIGAGEIDELIARLQETLGLTVYMITHDLDSIFTICDRIAVLAEKKVLVEGDINHILAYNHEWVQNYFNGKRGRNF